MRNAHLVGDVVVTTTPTEYTITAVPDEDNINAYHFRITVAYRGRGKWAVLRHGFCLGTDGEWDYESIPSNREEEWLETHRFDLGTALDLARAEAPKVTVNGYTVKDALKDSE